MAANIVYRLSKVGSTHEKASSYTFTGPKSMGKERIGMRLMKLGLFALSALIHPCFGEDEVIPISLPPSAYAFSDNPACNDGTRMNDILGDPQFIASVSKLSPYVGAGFYVGVKVGDGIEQWGGDLSKFHTMLRGGSRSVCQSFVAVLPKGGHLQMIKISNRNGAENWVYTPSSGGNDGAAMTRGGALSCGTSGDYAGWEGVYVARTGERWVIGGTAKNWSHDQRTHQIFRVVYSTAPKPPNPPTLIGGTSPQRAAHIGLNQSVVSKTTVEHNDAYFLVTVPRTGTLHVSLSGVQQRYRVYIASAGDGPMTVKFAESGGRADLDQVITVPGNYLIRTQPITGHSAFQVDVRFTSKRIAIR